MPILDARKIGKKITHSFLYSRGSFELLVHAFRNISSLKIPPLRSVLYRQIYFTGIETLDTVAMIGILLGIVIITQVTNLVGSNAPLVGKVLVWTVVREVGPLLTAILVIARSSSAVASELGAMRMNREFDHLMVLGIDPLNYLILPRIIGITVSVFILTFYFQIAAIAGGLVLSSLLNRGISFSRQFQEILSTLGILDIGVSLLKSLLFGLFIATASCYHGFRSGRSITEIPQATTNAVMHSLLMVFLADGLITVASFL